MDDDSTHSAFLRVMPLTVSATTIKPVFGLEPRNGYRTAKRLGVPIWHVAGKRLIPVAPFLAALEREALKNAPSEPPRELTDEEERDAVLARLGLRRAEGAR